MAKKSKSKMENINSVLEKEAYVCISCRIGFNETTRIKLSWLSNKNPRCGICENCEAKKETSIEKVNFENEEMSQTIKLVNQQVYIRDGGKCHYCQEEGEELNRIIPASLGGFRSVENTVCCCSYCNHKKSNQHYNDFKKYIEAISLEQHLKNKELWTKHTLEKKNLRETKYKKKWAKK